MGVHFLSLIAPRGAKQASISGAEGLEDQMGPQNFPATWKMKFESLSFKVIFVVITQKENMMSFAHL